MKVPGQCCEEWVCDDSKDALEELEGFFGKEFGLDASEGELTRNNELIAIVKGGLKMLPGELISGLRYPQRRMGGLLLECLLVEGLSVGMSTVLCSAC